MASTYVSFSDWGSGLLCSRFGSGSRGSWSYLFLVWMLALSSIGKINLRGRPGRIHQNCLWEKEFKGKFILVKKKKSRFMKVHKKQYDKNNCLDFKNILHQKYTYLLIPRFDKLFEVLPCYLLLPGVRLGMRVLALNSELPEHSHLSAVPPPCSSPRGRRPVNERPVLGREWET